jgi:hypothetical protein
MIGNCGECNRRWVCDIDPNECDLWPDPVPMTNADHIRAMSDEELADLLCTADWCETCDQMREEGTCKAMELDGPLNKHCVSAALRWLRQPYKEEA